MYVTIHVGFSYTQGARQLSVSAVVIDGCS